MTASGWCDDRGRYHWPVAFGAKLTPLADTGLVDEAQARELKAYGITSVEELVSAAIGGRSDVAGLLGLDEATLADLLDRAEALLDDDTRRALHAPVEKRAMGANPPGSYKQAR